jgi:hypothetical protein
MGKRKNVEGNGKRGCRGKHEKHKYLPLLAQVCLLRGCGLAALLLI